jgi:diguanylate cyclase (GGDEF)-like protein
VTNRVRRARAVRQRGSGRRTIERAAALYDRTRLVDRIGESLAGAAPATPGGILFLIVDGAQALREKLGLMAFDLAMQQAGAMLAESLGQGDLAARFGDSSFVVLAPAAGREEISTLAARLGRAFAEKLIESESGNLTLAASIGVATFGQGWRDAAAIVNAAERAATRARSVPGDRIVVSPGPGSADATDADAPLRNALAAALAAGGLQLLYQPIASLHGGTSELFQVLLRMRDDNGRRYSAAEIVPMAERNGLIDDVDRAVLARCVEVLGERLGRGRRTALLVSQSIHGLGDATRFDWLRASVEARGLDPAQLVLELRFDDIVPRLAAAGAWLAAARAAGFRTAIGAFEPNPASLQSLQHLVADLIRVSGRFIAQLDSDRSKVLAGLVEAAHGRGTMIVAPMVEDARTAAMLWGTGVDCIQGDFVQSAGPDLEFDFRAATL